MQTRSSARNVKKSEVVTPRPSRRSSKDAPLPKATKKNEVTSPPEEPSSPGSPHVPSPQSQTSTSSDENRIENVLVNENQNVNETSNVNNNDATNKPTTANNTSTTPSSSKAVNPLSRSMTLRSSLGARPKKRIWSPESFRRERWSDEVKFHRFPKKLPRKQIRTYASDDSSSESSEMERQISRSRSRKGGRRLGRIFDSSDESLDEEDDDESDSEDDSDDESDEDSYDSEDLRGRKRKLRSKGHIRKRKFARQGVKSDTEGAEALMGLADSVLLMDEEPKRSKTPQHAAPETRPRKHRPQPLPKEDRTRDPGFDIRNFLVPPPVFPKTAIGSVPTPSTAPQQQQPIWKRGALHAAIAYYVFYQQRYDLLQQLSIPNAQYAQKFLLALSLDPTSEAKMLRERAEAARQQIMQNKGQAPQSKPTPEQPVLLSPSPFSLYPNTSPASGYLQPQARTTQKPVPILLSPSTTHPSGSTSAMKPEASSIATLDSLNSAPQLQKAPTEAPSSASFSSLTAQTMDTSLPLTSTPVMHSSSKILTAAPSQITDLNPSQTPVGRSETIQPSISPANGSSTAPNPPLTPIIPSSQSAIPSSSSLDQPPSTEALASSLSSSAANPSTPTTQNTSLEDELTQSSTQETPRATSGQETEIPSGFEPVFLNFEDEPSSTNSEQPALAKESAQPVQPGEVLESLRELTEVSENQSKHETRGAQPTIESLRESTEVSENQSKHETRGAQPTIGSLRELTEVSENQSKEETRGAQPTIAPADTSNSKTQSSSTDAIPVSSLESTEAGTQMQLDGQPQKAPAQDRHDDAASAITQSTPAHNNQTTTSTTTTTSTNGDSEAKLETADWNSFSLGSTFRKGRMSAYTPAQVMVSPFNYLMSPTEPSRLFEYNNKSEMEDINKNAFYAEQQRQHYARYQQRQPYMPKPAYPPFPMPPNFYDQPQAFHPRMNRNQPHGPPHTRHEGQRHDPNKAPVDQYAYNPGLGQHHGPHFQPPEWHHYDPQEEYAPNQMHTPQGAPFQMDPRTGIMHRVIPPKAHDNTKMQDGELWTQQHPNAHFKHPQLFHSQPILPTQQPPEQPQGSLNSLQDQQNGSQMPLSQQQQISARHSTENLANLKRQIRSKALAAKGAGFGGSFRRASHIQQLQQLQQQGNLQAQPMQAAYQPSGHPEPRYIVISDDTEQKPAQPNSDLDKPSEPLDLTAPDGDEKEKEEVPKGQEQATDYSHQTQAQLQQQLQQQQMRMIQQQKEQAALLEYQKQMHQRALLSGSTPSTQPPSSDAPASITIQPNIAPESVPSYMGNQHYQRLQQLHFQFKQHQRLQQLQKQPQTAQPLASQQGDTERRQPPPPPQASAQPPRKQPPGQQYLVQYTQYQHYPNHTSHMQLHQAQPPSQPTNSTSQISLSQQTMQSTNPAAHPQIPSSQPTTNPTQSPQSQPTNAPHPQPHPQQSQPQAQQQIVQQSTQHQQPPLSQPQPQPTQPQQIQPHQSSQSVQSHPQQHNSHQIPQLPHQQSAQQPASQQIAQPQRPPHPQAGHLQQQQMHMPQNVQQMRLAQKMHVRDLKLVQMPNMHKLQPHDKQVNNSAEHLDMQKSSQQPLPPQYQEMQAQAQTQSQPPQSPQPQSQPSQSQQASQKSQPQSNPQILQAQQYIMQQTNRIPSTHPQQNPAQTVPTRTPAQAQMQQWQYVMPQYSPKVVPNPNQNNMPLNAHYPANQQKLTPQQQQVLLQQQQLQAQVQAQMQAQAQQTQQAPAAGPVLMQFTQVSPSKFRKLPSRATQSPRGAPAQPPTHPPQSTPTQSHPPLPQVPPSALSSSSSSSSSSYSSATSSISSSSPTPSPTPSQNIPHQFQHKLQLEPLVRPPKQEHTKPTGPPSTPN